MLTTALVSIIILMTRTLTLSMFHHQNLLQVGTVNSMSIIFVHFVQYCLAYHRGHLYAAVVVFLLEKLPHTQPCRGTDNTLVCRGGCTAYSIRPLVYRLSDDSDSKFIDLFSFS